MAKATVSFVTQEILAAGRIATLHTQPSNVAMLSAARSVGFIDGEPL
jgi:predicted GNAT family acetyltransferase